MTTTYYLGVDPGLCGALALFEPTSSLAMVYDMPKAKQGGISPVDLNAMVKAIVKSVFSADPGAQLHGVVENVHSLPRQAGVFAFGLSTGIIHGVLGANGVPFSLVAPSQWKPAMGLGRKGDESAADTKTRARKLAAQLFPSIASEFARVKDDGRAEALLLAAYFAHKPTKGGSK